MLAIEAVPNNDPVNDPEIEDPDTPPSTFKAAPVPCINKLPDSSALPENGNPTPVPDVPLVPLVPFVPEVPEVPFVPDEPDDPLVPSIADLYVKNKEFHDFKAREYTALYASR